VADFDSRQLARLGWLLWIASLVTPDLALSGIGLLTPIMGSMIGSRILLDGLFEHHNLWYALAGLGMVLGVAVNLTLFFPTKRWLSIASIAAPFISVACTVAIFPRPSAVLEWLFIYPWMAGIVLIHVARLQTSLPQMDVHQNETVVSGDAF